MHEYRDREQLNWCSHGSGGVCYTRSVKCYTSSKCIAVFAMKYATLCYYMYYNLLHVIKTKFFKAAFFCYFPYTGNNQG